MADIETGYWTERETVEILLPELESIRSRELGRRHRQALSQPSSCRQGPRFCPSLNYNRRLQASQAHQLDGRPLLASPPSIFRSTAPTFFHVLSSLCILSAISSANCCRIFSFILSISATLIKRLDCNCLQHSHVKCELCRCRTNTDCCVAWTILYRRELRVCMFSFRTAGASTDHSLLSGSSCSNKWNHLV